MKAIFNVIVVLLFVVSSSFVINDDANTFIKGAWVTKEGAMKRIDFMENDMVEILSESNGEKVAMHVHYEVTGINKGTKEITVQFLRKNLFQDKFDPIKLVNFQYKNDDHLVMLTEKGESINFYRDNKQKEHSYR